MAVAMVCLSSIRLLYLADDTLIRTANIGIIYFNYYRFLYYLRNRTVGCMEQHDGREFINLLLTNFSKPKLCL